MLRSGPQLSAAAVPPSANGERPRLWIDRVFAAKGAGTVVTGTLTGGLRYEDSTINVTTFDPFDLEAAPNFARAIEESELPWPPDSGRTYPLKDW